MSQTKRRKMVEQAVPTLTRHDLEAKIVKRCREDEAFRKEFTADPAGAFTKYLEVPKDSVPKIVVHEEGGGSWHIVIPARLEANSGLSDQSLEQVAGGPVRIPSVYIQASAILTAGLAASGLSALSIGMDGKW
jgi:hypothetical protein